MFALCISRIIAGESAIKRASTESWERADYPSLGSSNQGWDDEACNNHSLAAGASLLAPLLGSAASNALRLTPLLLTPPVAATFLLQASSHDFGACPFSHSGEKTRRRSILQHQYRAIVCPDMQAVSGRC